MEELQIEQGRGWLSEQLDDPETRRAYDMERAAIEFTEQLEAALDAVSMSRASLAEALGKSRPYVTQALRRGQNLTIKTMVDLASACSRELHIMLTPRSEGGGVVFAEPYLELLCEEKVTFERRISLTVSRPLGGVSETPESSRRSGDRAPAPW